MNNQTSTKHAITMITNGWLTNPHESIHYVYNELYKMVRNRKTFETVEIFHAEQTKQFIESTLSNLVAINIIDSRVCAKVGIILNIDWNEISTDDYDRMVTKMKQSSSAELNAIIEQPKKYKPSMLDKILGIHE